MKKILVFCFCTFAFVGCTSDGMKDVLQAFNELTTPTQGYNSTNNSITTQRTGYADYDSATIKEVVINSYDLFIKGDLHKCAEYYHFESNFGRENWYQVFYRNSGWENDKIKKHGGIESRDIVIVSKSEDGKSARVQVYIKYKDGYLETADIIKMIKINSKWLKVYSL